MMKKRAAMTNEARDGLRGKAALKRKDLLVMVKLFSWFFAADRA